MFLLFFSFLLVWSVDGLLYFYWPSCTAHVAHGKACNPYRFHIVYINKVLSIIHSKKKKKKCRHIDIKYLNFRGNFRKEKVSIES